MGRVKKNGESLIINSGRISVRAKAENLNSTEVDCAFYAIKENLSGFTVERTRDEEIFTVSNRLI